MKLIAKTAAALAALAALLASPAAHAQKWVPTGIAELSSGVEGGGGARATSMDTAPVRMRVGADMYVDEDPENIFGGAVLFGVTPKTSFGVDGRYTRVVREKFAFSIGATAILQPGSLVGPTAAAEYRMPLGKSFTFTAGPDITVFCLGSDLPDRTIIWQLLVKAGLRVQF